MRNDAAAKMRKRFQDELDRLAACFDPKYKVGFWVKPHFVERIIERYNGNFDRGSLEVIKAIEKQIPIVIYYMHLDTILPERGKIAVGDYEIRGNVYNDRYVLTTFVKS